MCVFMFHYLILSDQCLQLYESEQLIKAVLHKFLQQTGFSRYHQRWFFHFECSHKEKKMQYF